MHQEERRSRRHYERVARWYDWRNKLAAWVRGSAAAKDRRRAIKRLGLEPGQRVLEVAVGTGTNLPEIDLVLSIATDAMEDCGSITTATE